MDVVAWEERGVKGVIMFVTGIAEISVFYPSSLSRGLKPNLNCLIYSKKSYCKYK